MRCLFFPACLLLSLSLYGQTNHDSTLYRNVSVHFGFNQIKEENLHPKVHYGTISGLSYSRYDLSGKGSFLEFGLFYSRLKTGFEDLSASLNGQLFLAYSKIFTVDASPKQILSIGPLVGLKYNISYYPHWDESHLYWANDLSLGAKSILQYRLSEKTTLLADLGLSFVSLMSRPEKDRQYKIDDLSFRGIMHNFHSNIEMTAFHKALKFSFKKEAQFRLTDNYLQSIFYQYNYTRMDSSHAHLFQNSLHAIGLKFYFL
jgi:hypothetical protein